MGEWKFGFARSIGRCSVLDAELWAILDGLRHAWQLGFNRVQLESDCYEAIECILAPDHVRVGKSLVMVIRELLKRPWEVTLKHICRSANAVADGLAILMRGQPLKEMVFILLRLLF
ncbi:hypothetical protein GQ457_03G009820 [Hibiscus cannabinus]